MDNHKSRRTEIQKRSERWPLELQQQFQTLQEEYRQGKDGKAPMSQLAAFTAAWEDVKPSAEEWEAENPEEDTDRELELLQKRSGSSNLDTDLLWAYDNLGNPKAKQKDAPSTSAWFILEYGREAKKTFLDVMLKYVNQQKKGDADRKKFEDDQRRSMSVLERFSDVCQCPHCGGSLL